MGTLLDNDSLRVVVGLRLGCAVCEPHDCVCVEWVDACGHHGLSCVKCAGRRPRHHAFNEILRRRALIEAEVPCTLEPPGRSRSDCKRPDGLALIPWWKGRCLVWNATCVNTFAACHLSAKKLAELERRREQFLAQRILLVIQRGNAASLSTFGRGARDGN